MVSISPPRPAWAEVLTGLSTFAVLMLVFALGFSLLPADQPVLQGVVGSTAGGIAGTGAFAAAAAIRIRSLRPFGFRPVPPRWLLIAAMLGVACYGITYLIQTIHGMWFGHGDPQTILHAAARGGVIPFLASLVGGAVLTPFGEEVLFRGVVANAWHRYGAWASVGASSLVFGMAHGISVILPIAIMVGIVSAVMFHRAGSIWPCVVLHGVYNGANSVASALHLTPM
jgi:membrane protease YdiL (CAAX protease family)